MQTAPLSISRLLLHGAQRHSAATIVTLDDKFRPEPTRFDVFGNRCAALAHALHSLGVRQGDVVGVLAGNLLETLESMVGVPSMGAVVHPVNVRMPSDTIVSAVRATGDRVLIVDPRWMAVARTVVEQVSSIEHVVFIGTVAPRTDFPDTVTVHAYESLIDGLSTRYPWPEIDEHSGAVVAFSSGTTGQPKGVVYSHRSIWLHSMELCMAESAALSPSDRVLITVPLFHVMSWGLPYAALMSGASVLFARGRVPNPLPSGADVAALLRSHRPNKVATSPVVWMEVHRQLETHPQDISHLDEVLIGGASVPGALVDAFTERYGVRILQAFGMTETSPLVTVARPDPRSSATRRREQVLSQGRFPAAVEARLVDQGRVVPNDGSSLGELQLRGPWITTSYLGGERPDKYFDGSWLRTGDVAAITPSGFLRVIDRLDDVILSGGEWISSVELENAVMQNSAVAETACVGVPDQRWGQRPLVLVVRKAHSAATAHALWHDLDGVIELWKRPDHWAFVDQIPRTTVGKFDKKVIRARYAEGQYQITTISPSQNS